MKTYDNTDAAYEAGQEWIIYKSDRWEKLEFLKETCSPDFLENHLMDEMVRWMVEHDFEEFYKHLCRNWGIVTPQELEYQMNS